MSRRQLVWAAKAATYRIAATLVTTSIVFATTWRWQLALAAGAADFVMKVGLYWAFENVWASSLRRVGLTDAGEIIDSGAEGAR